MSSRKAARTGTTGTVRHRSATTGRKADTMTAPDARRGAVVVTGAHSGIGLACTVALEDAGYLVFAGVRKPLDAEGLRRRSPERICPLILDVADPAQIAAARDTIADRVGPAGLAGLVNVAGIGAAIPVETLTPAQLREIFDVNVFGLVEMTRVMLPLIRAGRGRIVNIGSVGDRFSMPFGGALSASKAAVAMLTESMRMELRPWGIHVCLIEPASINTPAVDRLETAAGRMIEEWDDHARALYAAAVRAMVRRAAAQEREHGSSADTVAGTVLRALSVRRPASRYLTGRHARLLAGMSALLPDRAFDQVRLRVLGQPTGFGSVPDRGGRLPNTRIPG